MKRIFLLCLILTGFGWLPVNAQPGKHANKPVKLDTLTVKAKAGVPEYRETSPTLWDITHTRLAISFNQKEKTAAVKEWIQLYPYAYATDSLVLDAKAIVFDSIKVAKGKAAITRCNYQPTTVTIYFTNHVAAGDTLTLYLKYTASPYATATGGSAAIREDRGLYFINTDGQNPYRPAQIWTQGETEANSHWMVTIDKPNSRFSTQFEITVPDSFVTLSNGLLKKQIKQAKGMRTDIWVQNKSIAAYQAMMAIGNFSITHRTHGKMAVDYYTEPEYKRYADVIFKHTPEMIAFFSKKTGQPYPWDKYSQIIVRNYVSGAMENTSASLFGEFANANNRELLEHNVEDVVSHELFHQWFGDHVTCESWSNLTLNESFANYGEQLWRRYKYGNESANELAYNDLVRYLARTQFSDPQLLRYYYDDKEQMFDGVTYQKGGSILRYLNSIIGDKAFDKAMMLYQTRNALSSAEVAQWRMAVEEATGRDMNWFFNEWYLHAGHPKIDVRCTYDDVNEKVTVRVRQTQNDSPFCYILPLKTLIMYGKEIRTENWQIDKRDQTFTYNYVNHKRPLIVADAETILPGEVTEHRKPEDNVTLYKLCPDPLLRLRAAKAVFRSATDITALKNELLASVLKDPSRMVRSWGVDVITRNYNEFGTLENIRLLQELAHHDTLQNVRIAALQILALKKLLSETDLIKMVDDSMYSVAGIALRALADTNEDLGYRLAKKKLATKPWGLLDKNAWDIVSERALPDDVALFAEHVPREQWGKQYYFNQSILDYAEVVKDDSAFLRALQLASRNTRYETLTGRRKDMLTSFIKLYHNFESDEKEKQTPDARNFGFRKEAVLQQLTQLKEQEKDETLVEKIESSIKELKSGI